MNKTRVYTADAFPPNTEIFVKKKSIPNSGKHGVVVGLNPGTTNQFRVRIDGVIYVIKGKHMSVIKMGNGKHDKGELCKDMYNIHRDVKRSFNLLAEKDRKFSSIYHAGYKPWNSY